MIRIKNLLRRSFFTFFAVTTLSSTAQVKILFDATKAQTAGNADWVIDADQNNLYWNPGPCLGCGTESNPQKIATPSQTAITASTPETYWTGSLSNWGVDCAKRGYSVETLPYNGTISYGNSGNPQDLSHYKVFIIDEPNILFTASEKTAIMNFVKNGGGLFMISDHDVSDRNGDGYDSPTIWNDLMQNNSVQNNPFGITFNLDNFSQTSSNILSSSTDSILHGPQGNVTQVKWANGTSMTLNPGQNASVKGVVFQTGASTAGTNSVMCAYARYFAGKVAAIGDSSPTDDGTGDPNDVLYNGYTLDASGNHQRLLMNITIWLALGGNITGIRETELHTNSFLFPNPANNNLFITNIKPEGKVKIINSNGDEVFLAPVFVNNTMMFDTSSLPAGLYFVLPDDRSGKPAEKFTVVH